MIEPSASCLLCEDHRPLYPVRWVVHGRQAGFVVFVHNLSGALTKEYPSNWFEVQDPATGMWRKVTEVLR